MKNLEEEKMKKITEINGIEFLHIKSSKFKTNTINIFFKDNLSHESATKNALLPAVLKRGCEKYPTLMDISLYLEGLYGAAFEYQVNKKGEIQIIQFYMDIVSDKYTHDKADLFEKAFEFLYELLTKPLLKGKAFNPDYVAQEKENLKRFIESRSNDKAQYAVEKCLEEMCSNEPFSVYEYGEVKALEEITPENLYEHYVEFMETLPISVFISGDLEETAIMKMVERFKAIKRSNVKDISLQLKKKENAEVKNISEKMNVTQAKLSLGFRTNTDPGNNDYYTLMVYNGILGGGIHSKLFQNVREKASLAYYAFSRLEKFKGLMVISCGIEKENREKAVKIILEQIEAMKKGEISDYEHDSTLNTMENMINSLKDSQLQIVDYNFGQSIGGTNDTFEKMIEKLKKVTKQDIINISKRIIHDTTYFLEPDVI